LETGRVIVQSEHKDMYTQLDNSLNTLKSLLDLIDRGYVLSEKDLKIHLTYIRDCTSDAKATYEREESDRL
jgi:hypothetical protein